MTPTHESLKARQRAERELYPDNLGLRVHRALSWLGRADSLGREADLDGQFVFLWIAFNAAYATEIDDRYSLSEQATFREFIWKLSALDALQGRLEQLVWQSFPGSIRLLLENRFVFPEFWHWQSGRLSEAEWKASHSKAKRAAHLALGRRDTAAVLSIVLTRIYTLRNQLLHGGSTWGSSVNREQLRDAIALMGQLVPLLLEVMMDNPGAHWGPACYPVVNTAQAAVR